MNRMAKFLGCFLLSIWTAVTPAGVADVISVRADHWYPVNGAPDAEKPGFAIEILERIWGAEGHELDYQRLPWSRSLQMALRGQIDCVVGAYVSDAPDLLFPEHPLAVDEMSFYVAMESPWRYAGLDSLEETRIAVIGGYAYGEPLDSYIREPPESARLTVMRGNHALENNLRLLLAGRVDALVESSMIMTGRLRETGLDSVLRTAGSVEERHPIHVACSPALESSRRYLEIFDRGLERLRDSGELEEILDRYEIPASHRAH